MLHNDKEVVIWRLSTGGFASKNLPSFVNFTLSLAHVILCCLHKSRSQLNYIFILFRLMLIMADEEDLTVFRILNAAEIPSI